VTPLPGVIQEIQTNATEMSPSEIMKKMRVRLPYVEGGDTYYLMTTVMSQEPVVRNETCGQA
jgi:hypothetical protein